MSNQHFFHAVSHAFKEAKHMPSTGRNKSAGLAFFLGFLFGPIGTGLYLQTWTDFFVPLLFVIGGSVMTVGIGAPVFWILCGVWGAVRAK